MDYPMYDERMEHDACGIGAVIELSGEPSHRTVSDALTLVERLAHRAGCDAAGTTGDGVGILTQLPHALFTAWAKQAGLSLGEAREYGVAMLFLPQAQDEAKRAMQSFERVCAGEGLPFIGWRDVPTCPQLLGAGALAAMPRIMQGFVARPQDAERGPAFDRRLYLARKRFEKAEPESYVCSFSSRVIVYKGMMLVRQLRLFYEDLQSEGYLSALAMVHSRFSTNTVPSWQKAHPHRMLLHNGEINTIRGNADRMLAREETMRSPVLGARLADAYPVVDAGGSDSAMLDNALEFLMMNGLPLPLCGMALLPEAWQERTEKIPWQGMYQYYATLMEPWDGPAALLYTDGDTVCAQLDRNGLRPLRCALTDDNRLILSSEAGVLWEETRVNRRWRLNGGGILCADLRTGEWSENDALKARFAAEKPYERWVREGVQHMDDLPPAAPSAPLALSWQQLAKAHGYTYEDVRDVLLPMAEKCAEPIGSMGADEPLAALSGAHPSLYSSFKQRFAQVTNPPIDALREQCVTDTAVYIGDSGNLLSADGAQCRALKLDTPILTEEELNRIRQLHRAGFAVKELSICYPVSGDMQAALDALLTACDQAGDEGASILVLSDRATDARHIALPSLLAVSTLEQHLIRTKRRMSVSVVIESADVRDAHQAALLIAFGARAVAPYLAHACIAALCEQGQLSKPAPQAIADYNRALTNGVLHIASKMGVSTLQSYQSAQLFEAVGLDADFVDRYFTNTPHRLGGVGLAHIEAEQRWHHGQAFRSPDGTLDSVGFHKLRTGKRAEEHLYSPEVIHTLQRAVWENDATLFAKYAALVQNEGPRTIRSLMEFAFERCTPVSLDEVEPAESIVRRFQTGAMSYGSLSREAHECLAVAMNRIGGRSNTGEGGEAVERFGTERNSAVKQVASGRFGVTAAYLRSAREIQIKMAQGAKPGEGGHLPGAKVSAEVAATRCATPGLSLISPPPHHDIYSIEDLAELIYDLKCVNPAADVSVKLVSSTGVGTVASGVAKAGAQTILISGGEGGTGAAPLTSIHGAGLPWELGLSEAHQTLCKNGLRQRVKLETDGKLMTGRDVAVALLLGAETFAFATAPLITLGCRMMRVCNLDACPFGIATQNPALRKRFMGKPEYVERFMFFVAEQLRGILAKLGARTADELVGRGDLLRAKPDAPLTLDELIGRAYPLHFQPEKAYDFHLTERKDAQPIKQPIKQLVALRNADRAFGAMLPPTDAPLSMACEGCGGQSFGAFLTDGYTLALSGVANDYVGKGLCGGTLIVQPPRDAAWRSGDALIGNVALFGATSGKAFIAGTAGERFCVRNSGAVAVAEGVGDHGCEYMTGGRAVILGPVGDNFAAGMSGGIAYVWDADDTFGQRVNAASVDVLAVEGDFIAELRAIVEEHAAMTQSPVAAKIQAQWEHELPHFKLVIPKEYRRLLEGRA